MNSQEFLILNVTWISLLVLWYWRSRASSSKGPTQLNLHAQDSAQLVIPPEVSTSGSDVVRQQPLTSRYASFTSGNFVQPSMAAKNLNVIFNYNGHSWDAFEVLGLPAGSALPAVTAAYQRALKNASSESHEFLETAYKSILHRF